MLGAMHKINITCLWRQNVLGLLSVFVFAAHNLEEILTIQGWLETADLPPYFHGIYGHDVFFIAAIILVVIYFVIALLHALCPGPVLFNIFLLSFSAIAANALATVLASIMRYGYTPGLWTSVFVILPFSMMFYYLTARRQEAGWKKIAFVFSFGFLLQMPIIMAALWMAGMLKDDFRVIFKALSF